MPVIIDSFDGEYAFLSNYYGAPVTLEGITFKTNEHGFHFFKTNVAEERQKIRQAPTPGKAKRLGRKCTMRKDWDGIKDMVMLQLCRAKFRQNPDLAQKLIDTGDAELIEGNYWNDRYWGVCQGTGQNKLGQILMMVRRQLQGRETNLE